MKNLLLSGLCLLVACLCSASCTSVKAQADFEQGLDFSTFQTFAMAAPPREAPVGIPSYSEIGGREINEELALRIEAKGFTRVDESVADLIVSFSLAGEQRDEVRSTGPMVVGPYAGWYGANWYDAGVYTVNYVKGTLIVDAFDRARERVVWHGWSSVSLYSEKDATKQGHKALEAVMEKFPAR
jgi:Domain of unknown function (DUF4136)